jgi:predicted nucleic acid-binding protein
MKEATNGRYLLDANLLAAFFRGKKNALSLVTPWIAQKEATTSILVYGEIIEYLMGFADFTRHRAELLALLRDIHVYPLTYAVLERYAQIRRTMRPPHGPGLIGDADTLIAATALEHGLTLVTTDSDSARVPGLLCQVLPREALK